MREKGILLSSDGPYNNVIKIKPPLPFNKDDSDYKYVQLDPFFRKIIFGLAFKASYYESNENLLIKDLFSCKGVIICLLQY